MRSRAPCQRILHRMLFTARYVIAVIVSVATIIEFLYPRLFTCPVFSFIFYCSIQFSHWPYFCEPNRPLLDNLSPLKGSHARPNVCTSPLTQLSQFSILWHKTRKEIFCSVRHTKQRVKYSAAKTLRTVDALQFLMRKLAEYPVNPH